MTTKPGEVYRVDLGSGGKVRMMLVVSREDCDAPRTLALCVPITSSCRESHYEVELPTIFPDEELRECTGSSGNSAS